MTPEERNLITGLFDRLRNAETNAPAKDHEAEDLIRQLTTQSPSAPYLLTQTLLVQEHALANAQTRIQVLERQAAQAQPAQSSGGGGFLSGLFGHSSTPAPAAPPAPMPVQPQAMPYPTTMNMAPSAGGGFLRSALTTAAGVAGGAALFEGIESLLGHNSGPFGGGLGGGGFMNNEGPREVVNNYYNDAPSGEHEHGGGGAGGGDNIPAGAADQPAHPGYEDARFDDSNFDKSNSFDQPANDSSFLNAGSDNSSLDNNFDPDNTDAGSSDFGGGGDFVGNDNSGGDDNGTV